MDPRLWAIIQRYAPRYGLDPRAVAAVSMNESGGRFGAVGDNGTSFGPWQLHVGGALPRGRGAAWANSLAGIQYALRSMAGSGARGLRGQAAVSAIARNFERPANPGAEIATAMRYYGTPGFARGGGRAGPMPAMSGGGGRAGGGGGRAAMLLAMNQPISVQPYQSTLPTAHETLQNLFASQPVTNTTAPTTSTAPGAGTFANELDSIHSHLLNAGG